MPIVMVYDYERKYKDGKMDKEDYHRRKMGNMRRVSYGWLQVIKREEGIGETQRGLGRYLAALNRARVYLSSGFL